MVELLLLAVFACLTHWVSGIAGVPAMSSIYSGWWKLYQVGWLEGLSCNCLF